MIDELKPFRALNIDDDDTGIAYPKASVDAAIAEKDAYIAYLKKQLHDLCAHSMDVSGQTIDKVSELMDENARLKSYIKCAIDRGLITGDAAVSAGRELLEVKA